MTRVCLSRWQNYVLRRRHISRPGLRRKDQQSVAKGLFLENAEGLFHRALCATHLEKRNGRGAGIAAQADGPRCRRTTVEIEPRGRRLETCRDTPPHGHLRALPALGDGPPTCEAEWRSAQGPSPTAARSTRQPRTPIGPPSKTPILDCPRPSALFGLPAVATVHPHPLHPLPPRLPPCRAAPRLCIDRPPFDVTVEPCPCSPACPLPPIPQCGSHRTRR